MAQHGFSVIGDALHFDGYVVGRLRSDLPATAREELNAALEGVSVQEDKERQGRDEFVDALFAELKERAEKLTEGGMIEAKAFGSVLDELEKVRA